MERSNYFGDEFVTKDDLNNTESTKADAIRRRIVAISGQNPNLSNDFGDMVVGLLGSTALQVSVSSGGVTIYIAAGQAVTNTGELITLAIGDSIQNGHATTTNGKPGQWSFAGPSGGIGRVKLLYVEATGSIKSDDVGNPFPTRFADSYEILIDVNTPPTAGQVLLATFTSDGSGNVADNGSLYADARKFIRAKRSGDIS